MRVPVLLLAIASLGCGNAPSAPDASGGPTTGAPPAAGARVLFVGNSLTEGNGLAQMVRTLASQAGEPIAVEAITFGGYALEDHWNEGSARRAIARGGWRFVVLRQGPSSLPE